ncbi:MAG: hypothetical protein AB7S75_01645 [Desulfococcaceae bacterium]
MAEIAEIQYYQKNKCIINEGDTSASLYIIAEGKANAFTLNHKKEKMRLNSGSGSAHTDKKLTI